jgi:hypothetical protein
MPGYASSGKLVFAVEPNSLEETIADAYKEIRRDGSCRRARELGVKPFPLYAPDPTDPRGLGAGPARKNRCDPRYLSRKAARGNGAERPGEV